MCSTNSKAAARIKSKTEAYEPTKDTSLKTSEDSERRQTEQRIEWTIREDSIGTRRLTSFLLCLDHEALFSKYLLPSQSLLCM